MNNKAPISSKGDNFTKVMVALFGMISGYQMVRGALLMSLPVAIIILGLYSGTIIIALLGIREINLTPQSLKRLPNILQSTIKYYPYFVYGNIVGGAITALSACFFDLNNRIYRILSIESYFIIIFMLLIYLRKPKR